MRLSHQAAITEPKTIPVPSPLHQLPQQIQCKYTMAEDTELPTFETRISGALQPGNQPQEEINYRLGYPSLASFIASDEDKTTVIYRRFDRLSARNILYMQSELADLEAQQDAFDKEDVTGSMVDVNCARNWNTFTQLSQSDDRQKARMKLVKDIRETIKTYSKCRPNDHSDSDHHN